MKSDPVNELENIFRPDLKVIKEIFPGAIVLPPEQPPKVVKKRSAILKSKSLIYGDKHKGVQY